MPENRLAKARATLPEGYQFGDARGDGKRVILLEPDEFLMGGPWDSQWRPVTKHYDRQWGIDLAR